MFIGLVTGLLGFLFFAVAMIMIAEAGKKVQDLASDNERLKVDIVTRQAIITALTTEITKKDSNMAEMVEMMKSGSELLVAADETLRDYSREFISLKAVVESQQDIIIQQEILAGFLIRDPTIAEILNLKLKDSVRN